MLAAALRWGGGEAERPFLPRAFSVMRAGERSETLNLQFMLEDVGPGTNRLCELHVGDELRIVGPLGIGFRPPAEERRPLLVGGGVGTAPLAILQDGFGEGRSMGPAMALLGFRDAEHARGAQLLKDATVATDDGSAGHHGFATDLLLQELHRDGAAEVYACGPPPMLEAVRVICAERDVPAQLALESGMACGFGACFGCVVHTRHGYQRVCVDGPVFAASDLDLVTGH
jgi:NAD(P)H-flavin reductase